MSLSGNPRAPSLNDFEAILHGVDLCKDHFGRMPNLIVLDGLSAFHGDEENNSHVALKVMAKLHELGDRAGAPVLLIHHQRKTSKLNSGAPAQEGARGSSAWAGAVDMQWHMQKRGTDLVLSVTKSNLATEPRPIAFTINDGGIEVRGIVEREAGDGTARQKAEAFLNNHLADGPKPSEELRQKAKELSISNESLYKAKDNLGIESTTSKVDARKRDWSLPQIRDIEQRQQADEDAQDNNSLDQSPADGGDASDVSAVSFPYTPNISAVSALSGGSGSELPGALDLVPDSRNCPATVRVGDKEVQVAYVILPVLVPANSGWREASDKEER